MVPDPLRLERWGAGRLWSTPSGMNKTRSAPIDGLVDEECPELSRTTANAAGLLSAVPVEVVCGPAQPFRIFLYQP